MELGRGRVRERREGEKRGGRGKEFIISQQHHSQ